MHTSSCEAVISRSSYAMATCRLVYIINVFSFLRWFNRRVQTYGSNLALRASSSRYIASSSTNSDDAQNVIKVTTTDERNEITTVDELSSHT